MIKLFKIKGFTIIELVIVLTLLGILVSVALPRFVNLSGDARDGVENATLNAVRTAITLYIAQNDGSEPTAAQVDALLSPQADTVNTDSLDFTHNDGASTPFSINLFQEDCSTAATGADVACATL